MRRSAWPRIALAGACALALALPWRLWFHSRDLTGELPPGGLLGVLDHLDRAWPASRTVVGHLVDFQFWLVVLPLAAVAVVLAVAGFAWMLWSFTQFELPLVQDEGVSPIVRLCGALVVLSAGLVPLLLDAAWRGAERPRPERVDRCRARRPRGDGGPG